MTAVKAGRREYARDLLIELVDEEPEHALAWLWLSELVEQLEDKIIALENVLLLNPDQPRVQARLQTLRQHRFETQASPPDKLTQAQTAVKLGLQQQAQSILRQLVREQPDHEQAWYLLSTIQTQPEEQIIALENVLKLNRHHHEAQQKLKQVRATFKDFLALGRAYEKHGDLAKAVAIYKKVARSAPVNADRIIAKNRLTVAQTALKKANMRITSPEVTVIRLTGGPPILFGLLLFIQSGLNPLQISILSYLGWLLVLAGSFLYVATRYAPSHTLWYSLLGETGLEGKGFWLQLSGFLLMLLPYFTFALAVFERFQNNLSVF